MKGVMLTARHLEAFVELALVPRLWPFMTLIHYNDPILASKYLGISAELAVISTKKGGMNIGEYWYYDHWISILAHGYIVYCIPQDSSTIIDTMGDVNVDQIVIVLKGMRLSSYSRFPLPFLEFFQLRLVNTLGSLSATPESREVYFH